MSVYPNITDQKISMFYCLRTGRNVASGISPSGIFSHKFFYSFFTSIFKSFQIILNKTPALSLCPCFIKILLFQNVLYKFEKLN